MKETLETCVNHGLHLVNVDEDGYCENCGHQENLIRNCLISGTRADGKPGMMALRAIGFDEQFESNAHHYQLINWIKNYGWQAPFVVYDDDDWRTKPIFNIQIWETTPIVVVEEEMPLNKALEIVYDLACQGALDENEPNMEEEVAKQHTALRVVRDHMMCLDHC